MEAGSVTHDDEQRVVDADPEADHQSHVRGEGGNGDEMAEERHEHRTDAHAEDGGENRKAHR